MKVTTLVLLALALVAAPAFAEKGAKSKGKKGSDLIQGADRIDDSGSGSGSGSGAADKLDADSATSAKAKKDKKGWKKDKKGKELSSAASFSSNVQNGALIALGAGCVAVALVAVARRRSTQQYTALPDVAVEPCTHAASVGTQMTPNMVETASEKTPLVV
mmetsp:Transcript_7309/g.18742  ORF Transcript_7309/g.18742 Transcript_7309/m.18742 type:complete len:161 (+) Transcript_7309:150-632(+)|eukprot:CAMPEP_0182950702 /NCGR_PEP_ID=MMETSP0105_2-20130417/60896_1 /TAXON_ID=81532 ORGANISM="Acanthoeca-like sp., Strain 10tr" /NCGR_SAMPLE_ID=MMETSP0105_2 /ASSEMBLY_ACC=CAM_ASM_000205 /LENGTH=160 /DNA_ID=CAMNT_0025091005 /DNA_START=551 /DNA_END=1033 /DNA_ORIENTATION=+